MQYGSLKGRVTVDQDFPISNFREISRYDTQECYAVDQWLDVLYSQAQNLSDWIIAGNRNMLKTLAEYAGQKSTLINTVRRLVESLGDQMVKDKGLACKFIISAKPVGAPVTERAVPVVIFLAEGNIKCGDGSKIWVCFGLGVLHSAAVFCCSEAYNNTCCNAESCKSCTEDCSSGSIA